MTKPKAEVKKTEAQRIAELEAQVAALATAIAVLRGEKPEPAAEKGEE